MHRKQTMFAKPLIWLLRLYQLTLSRVIVAIFGPVCRFDPSCSAYAIACLRIHGAWRGSLLSVKRLSKCHPLHEGGYDPPPPVKHNSRSEFERDAETVHSTDDRGGPPLTSLNGPK